MNTLSKPVFFFLSVIFISTQCPALVPVPSYTISDTVRYNSGNDPAMIITVKPLLTTQPDSFKDTLFTSGLLSKLKAAYDSSKLVVISRVVQVKGFEFQLNTSDNQTCKAESVTVQIDTVLKGSLRRGQRTFIHSLENYMCINRYDSLEMKYRDECFKVQPSNSSYSLIQGIKFLFFLQDTSEILSLPGSADGSYLINEKSEVFYNAIDVNLDKRIVNAVPYLTIDFNRVLNEFHPTAVISRSVTNRKISKSNISVSVYDLLGKKVKTRTNSFLQRSSAARIVVMHGKNGIMKEQVLLK